jgi:glutamate-1-semialdehyde 2,1-aminomutase
LQALKEGHTYELIEKRGARLMDGLKDILGRHHIPARVQGFPGIFHVAFGTTKPLENYRDLFAIDRPRYVRFTTALVERGVRALERGAWFLSSEHDDSVIDRTLQAVESAASTVA